MGILEEIDKNICKHKIKIMEKELDNMDNNLIKFSLEIEKMKCIYNKVLQKDKAVGSSLNAIKQLKYN